MAYSSPVPHPDPAGPSTVPFPRSSELSLLVGGGDDFSTTTRPRLESWRRASALEVHELVYGSYYQAAGAGMGAEDAAKGEQEFRERVDRLYEADAVYENPLLTADGRTLISSLYTLTHKLSALALPRLTAFLRYLPLPFPVDPAYSKPYPLLRVWSEVLETCESESFDGARTAMLEQTLHVLLLPELHTTTGQPTSTDSLVPGARESTSTASLMSTGVALGQAIAPPIRLRVPWIGGQKGDERGVPSPLHFQLHVITRLQFNERGHIARHRDFWDLRDVADALIPFSPPLGWFARRLLAYYLLAVAWVFSLIPSLPPRAFPSLPPTSNSQTALPTTGRHTRSSTWTLAGTDSPLLLRTSMPMTRDQENSIAGLGLNFGEPAGRAQQSQGDGAGQAPDVDRDSMF